MPNIHRYGAYLEFDVTDQEARSKVNKLLHLNAKLPEVAFIAKCDELRIPTDQLSYPVPGEVKVYRRDLLIVFHVGWKAARRDVKALLNLPKKTEEELRVTCRKHGIRDVQDSPPHYVSEQSIQAWLQGRDGLNVGLANVLFVVTSLGLWQGKSPNRQVDLDRLAAHLSQLSGGPRSDYSADALHTLRELVRSMTADGQRSAA